MKVEYIGTRYPDALVQIKKGKNWVTMQAEFEHLSSKFESHMEQYKKDPDSCDMIICWEHDWDKTPEDLEVIELKGELEKIL